MSEAPLPPATPAATVSLPVLPEGRLDFGQAIVSPCATCATTPCCTYLPLHSFRIQTLRELDHALYTLNFEGIELGLSSNGQWGVYYHQPCRFLDGESRCTIYTAPERPRICEHYNPYGCWYKRSLAAPSEEYIRIDRRRMEFIASLLVFDEARNIVAVPEWAELVRATAAIELDSPVEAPPGPDAALVEWADIVAGNAPTRLPVITAFDERYDPCTGCGTHCCRTLIFPHGAPSSRSGVDFLKFALGFPGIELGIGADTWNLVVHTRCRHLENNRCSIHGRPERPLICRFYDAWSCQYKTQFGTPQPAGYLRVRLEQFRWLVEPLRFDDKGALVELPAPDALRAYLEARWRDALAAPAT